MNDTPHAELSRKLQNIGASPTVASREVTQAMAMSPTNGADYLKCLGLDYLDSFRLLSLVTNEEIQSSRNGSGSPLKNPAVMIAGGSVLILIGGLGVLRGFSVHSNAVIIDHGITLCLGIFLCVWPLIKGARK